MKIKPIPVTPFLLPKLCQTPWLSWLSHWRLLPSGRERAIFQVALPGTKVSTTLTLAFFLPFGIWTPAPPSWLYQVQGSITKRFLSSLPAKDLEISLKRKARKFQSWWNTDPKQPSDSPDWTELSHRLCSKTKIVIRITFQIFQVPPLSWSDFKALQTHFPEPQRPTICCPIGFAMALCVVDFPLGCQEPVEQHGCPGS